jgi:hypothetical protein
MPKRQIDVAVLLSSDPTIPVVSPYPVNEAGAEVSESLAVVTEIK